MAMVSVVLVTYESAADLAACLATLPAAAGPHELEVLVVDNASRDGSAEVARGLGVKVLENPANLGLSRAIDIGAAATGAPWLLLVNPDTRLAPGSLARMLATATADPAIGCVGPHLRNSDGSEYPTGRRFPSILVGTVHAALLQQADRAQPPPGGEVAALGEDHQRPGRPKAAGQPLDLPDDQVVGAARGLDEGVGQAVGHHVHARV